MNKRNWFALIGSIALVQVAGFIGAIFTMDAIPTWYKGLIRPDLAPPNWVFGPVWTTLYVLMGIALFLVWRRRGESKGVKVALVSFAVQLVLNVLWSVIFFGLRSPGLALIEITLLWIAIAVNIAMFSRVSKPAAWLLVPYIAWVSFAAYLNSAIWVLNR